LLLLISEIKATKTVVCDVRIRDDPFDSGFQKVRTQSVICEFNNATEITEPTTILVNPVNENVTELLLGRNKKNRVSSTRHKCRLSKLETYRCLRLFYQIDQ